MKALAAMPPVVAKNIRGVFGARLAAAPAYVTTRRSGDGFIEVAELLLGAIG